MKSNIITQPIILTSARLEAIADKFVFGPMGTSLASMKMLRILHQQGSLTPKNILDRVGGTKSNISQRLNHLQERGYIKREYASVQNDKRKVIVTITKEGETQLSIVDKRLNKAQLKLIKYFSQEEIENHLKFHAKINQIIDQEEKNLTKIFK